MSSLQTLLRIWRLAFTHLGIGLLVAIGVGWWLGWKWSVIPLVLIVWSQAEWWSDMQANMLRSLPDDIEFVILTDETQLEDQATLQHLTDRWQALGFEKLQDFHLAKEYGGKPEYYGRLLVHPQHHCFVEIVRSPDLSRPDQPVTLQSSVHSLLTPPWYFSTTTLRPSGISYMWRDPKGLWQSIPQSAPAEQLQAHLTQRAAIAQDLNITIQPDLSWDTYLIHEETSVVERKQRYRRKHVIWALIEATWFELKQPQKWMGDYTQSRSRPAA